MRVPQVESVYIDRADDMIMVWTIINDDEEAVCDAIYNEEKRLIQDLQERFDFHVIARRGRELRSFISLSCRGWARG